MSRRASRLRQLTIRGFDPAVEATIRALARREHLSLNQVVMQLLRRATGVGAEGGASVDRVGESLDHLAGTWTAKDEREFTRAIAPLERIDRDLWGEAPPRARRRA